jgi:hypothetical protein
MPTISSIPIFLCEQPSPEVGKLLENESSIFHDPALMKTLPRFTQALESNALIVNRRVRANLLDKHILPLFPTC